MDDLLPSYESVIHQSPWELIAPYLPSDTLCSAALVCQRWHEIFTPQLWGNPASHFGTQNDTVYVALTRFKRTLFWSRLSVRELTHTLHLPPAHAEIYGGPHAEWLRDCLERLPRLQSLIVNGLPFFDHAALLTLRHASQWWKSRSSNAYPIFQLRLLDASGCTNATSTGLAEALPHFLDLVSLDLSRTFAAKDEVVLEKFKYLPNLRVLKLKDLGLKDADLEVVANAIGTRVRSLDISGNGLTDGTARVLLEYCVKETRRAELQTLRSSPMSPVGETQEEGDEMEVFGIENLDGHLRKKLMGGFVGSLAIEQATDAGITHLYLSRNPMTVEGISGLLRSKRLQALDIGRLPVVLQKPRDPSSDGAEEDMILPGVEKLTPILADGAAERLAYLRLNFSIVTKDAPMEPVQSPRAEMDAGYVKRVPNNSQELEAVETPQPELDAKDNEIHELPVETRPAELPAISVAKVESATKPNTEPTNIFALDTANRRNAPAIHVAPEAPEIKRGAAYAPEAVINEPLLPLLSPLSPILDASGGLTPMSPLSPAMGTGNDDITIDSDRNILAQPLIRPRHNSLFHVSDKRAHLDLRHSQEPRLHPLTIPKVHTLVLTDVPTSTLSTTLIPRLIQFIHDCATESSIAKSRAKYTYILPPGRSRKIAEREYANSLFALRHIVLEICPPTPVEVNKVSTSWRQYPTKSSTEDTDSEAFWDAAIHDFSFFSDEECGLPRSEPGRDLPLAAMSGLMLAPDPVPRRPTPRSNARQVDSQQSNPNTLLDVITEIARFRKERKEAYLSSLKLGESDPDVEGYWPGEITVVRKVRGDEGDVDFYGNRFEGGWLYR